MGYSISTELGYLGINDKWYLVGNNKKAKEERKILIKQKVELIPLSKISQINEK